MARKRRPNRDIAARARWLDELREVHERCLHKACRRAGTCQGYREQCITTLQEANTEADELLRLLRRRNEVLAGPI